MKTIRKLNLLLMLLVSTIILAQDSIVKQEYENLKIPKTLLDKIPRHQKSEFILAREHAIKLNPLKGNQSIYDELNISTETLDNVPNDQLVMFLNNKGYIHYDTSHHVDNSPTPEQALKLLYMLVIAVTLIILVCLILFHRRKLGEQKIVIKALETGNEIPIDLLKKNKRKSYQQIAIILIIPGIGLLLFSRLLNLPFEFSLPLIFLSFGFYAASWLSKKQE